MAWEELVGRWVHTEDASAGEVVFWHRARRERARPATKPVLDVYHFAGLEVWEQAWGQRPAECTAVGQLIFQKRLLGDGGGPPQGKDEEGTPVWASRAWWFGTGIGGGLIAEGCFTGEGALWQRRVASTVYDLDRQDFAGFFVRS